MWPKAKLEARLDGSKYLLPRYESAQRALRLQDQKKNEQVVKYKETHLWERSPEERAGSTYSFSSPNFRLHIILSWAGSNMMSSPWMLLKRPFLLTENLIAPTWLDSYLRRSFLRHRLSGTECTQASSRAPPPSFYSHPHTSGAQQTSSTLARFLSFEVGGAVVEVTLHHASKKSTYVRKQPISAIEPAAVVATFPALGTRAGVERKPIFQQGETGGGEELHL